MNKYFRTINALAIGQHDAMSEVDRLRSINAELVAALEDLVTLDQHERDAKATSYANGSPASKAWGKARATLERAKQ